MLGEEGGRRGGGRKVSRLKKQSGGMIVLNEETQNKGEGVGKKMLGWKRFRRISGCGGGHICRDA